MIPRFSQIQSDNQSDTPRKPVPANLTNLRDPAIIPLVVYEIHTKLVSALESDLSTPIMVPLSRVQYCSTNSSIGYGHRTSVRVHSLYRETL